MKMREWVQYYESEPRSKILNVISLEFSDTRLSQLVEPPQVVREIDWINKHWPKVVPDDFNYQKPNVQKYCLMSVKDSYTDFHVDFGGTSVWYHIIKGQKIFYLIPPTNENLLLYEQWVSSSHQSEVFFGSQVKSCYSCTLHPGNTLFIPTGWIHAVLTPEDSLVFGGNFLHRFNIELQFRIYEMELRLQTPVKFRHPSYEALTWYASKNFLRELKVHEEQGTRPPDFLIDGLKALIKTLQNWTNDRQALKLHKQEIPPDVRAAKNITEMSKYMEIFTSEDRPALNYPPESIHHERSIKLRFSHGNLTRHEIDGSKEHITMKLSLAQRGKERKTKKSKVKKEEVKEVMEDDYSDNDRSGDDDYVYSKNVSYDDAGTVINDKEDGLWNPKKQYYGENNARKRTKNPKTKDIDEQTETKKSKKCHDNISLTTPTSKPKTTKQRLGKLLGLDRSGHFLRK